MGSMPKTRSELALAIRGVALEMKLVDAAGELRKLDSLELLDFVEAIEQVTGASIPSSALNPVRFDKLDRVVDLVMPFVDSK